MATRIQQAQGWNTASSTSVPTQTAFGATPTAGNLLVLGTVGGDAFNQPTGYTPAGAAVSDYVVTRIWYRIADGTESTSPTFTMASATSGSWVLEEWSTPLASPLDQTAGLATAFPGGSTASVGTTATTTNPAELAFAVMGSLGDPFGAPSGGVVSWSNGFTNVTNVVSTGGTGGNDYCSTGTKVLSATGTVTTTATFAAPPQHVSGAIATFKMAASTALSVVCTTAQSTILSTATTTVTATASGGSGTRTYAWTKTSGPAASFSNTAIANPTFTPTGGAGTYVLTCTVTDDTGSTSGNVTVTVVEPSSYVVSSAITNSTNWTVTGTDALSALTDSSGSTYVTSSTDPTAQVLAGTFNAITAPTAGDPLTVILTMDKTPSGATASATAELIEGTTTRSTVSIANADIPGGTSGSDVTGQVTVNFPAADIAAVTDWSALKWKITVTATG